MRTNAPSTLNEHGSLLGLLAFWSAVAAAGSVAMIGVTSFTAFNPPNWLRIATMAPLPFLVFASIGFGTAGLISRSSRIWAITGLVITALSAIAFVVMITTGI